MKVTGCYFPGVALQADLQDKVTKVTEMTGR